MEFFTKLNDRAAEQISGGQTAPIPEEPRNFGKQVIFVLKATKSMGQKPREGGLPLGFKNFGQAVKNRKRDPQDK